MVRDLTRGKPWKVLLLYSLPLFGSLLFQQLYNAADSFIAGRYLGTQALAAVGNAYEITLVYIAFAFGCNIGTSVVTARYFGKKDFRGLKSTVYTALIACCALGLLLTVLGLVFGVVLLDLIQTTPEIFDDSLRYLNIYIAGFLFVLVYNISTGIFSALGDSKTPFIFLAISSVANVFVDILFVARFNMGVAGVAWATFLCQGLSGIVALCVVLSRLRRLESAEKPRIFSFAILKELARFAIPSILQQGFISVGNVIIQGFINSFGTAATGGYAAAIKINNVAILSMTSLGNGMSNYTAQNVGAGKPERIHEGRKYGTLYAVALALSYGLIFVIFGRPLTALFITDGNRDALEIGVSFLHLVSPFYFLIAIKMVSDAVLRGAGRMGMFMVSTLTDLVIRVILAGLLSAALGKITGIWYSWTIGVTLTLLFYRAVRKANFDLPPAAEQ